MSNFDTLFLDRDGVINVKLEGKYVQNFSEFEFISGSLSAISKLSQLFFRIIIILFKILTIYVLVITNN